MEIIKKDENGIEFYTIDLTGQSGMSQSGLAILAGIPRTTLRDLIDGLGENTQSEYLKPFIGKPLTLGGSEDFLVKGKSLGNLAIYKSNFCAAILKHYASPPVSNPVAVASCLKFMEIGINNWIQDITGWLVRSQNLEPYTNVYISRIENMRDHEVADDLWTIFREAAEVLLLLEKEWRVPINDYDILDGSIGSYWSTFREGKSWATKVSSYTHCYRDQRGERDCNAFSLSELPYFRKWLKEMYIPQHLPKYLTEKYGKLATLQIYTENGLLTDDILSLTEIKRSTQKQESRHEDFLLSRQKLLGGE